MFQKIKFIKLGYYLLILGIVAFAFYFYKSIFSYLIISLIFSFLFNPLVVMIENVGIKRIYAILIFYLIFFSNLVLFANIVVPLLIRQLHSFATTYSDFFNQSETGVSQLPYFEKITSFYEDMKALLPFVDFESITQNLIDWSNGLVGRIPNLLLSYTSNVFKLFTYFLSVPVISFFLLKDHIILRNKIYSLIPNRYFEITLIIFDKINSTIGKYLRAIFIQMVIIGTLASIVLSILGIRFGIMIGIAVGIINVIPYLGPLVGIVLGALVVMLTGGSSSLLVWTIIGLYSVQIIDNALVFPLVMGRSTNLHPVVIILTVIAGGATFGILGMLCAVPTVFLTTTLLKVLYHNLKQFELI